MSITSGSGGVSGMGASSSSSDASAMEHYGVIGSGLQLDVLREELIAGVECRCLRHVIAEFDVTACAIDANRCTTPGFCSKGPWWRAMPIRPKTVVAMPCS